MKKMEDDKRAALLISYLKELGQITANGLHKCTSEINTATREINKLLVDKYNDNEPPAVPAFTSDFDVLSNKNMQASN